jgi:hypothetical protein
LMSLRRVMKERGRELPHAHDDSECTILQHIYKLMYIYILN